MEIRQTRVVIRAKSFDRTCRFYAGSLALPQIGEWEGIALRGARFQAGGAVIEVIGRPAELDPRAYDEALDYQGPAQKMVIELAVPSAEGAYQEMLFRDQNIPGGLRTDDRGRLLFETHDPDGVRILCIEEG
jgi:catechol 2,3-dioxygenase-like lactoylglutathione lyase family enzyme